LLALVAIMVILAGASGSPGGGGGSGTVASNAGYAKIRELGAAAHLQQIHTDFLVLVARGESGGNNLRGLGIPEMFPPGTIPTKNAGQVGVNEARAARKAYQMNTGRLAGCPWPEDAYAFGSGGWFGFLPAFALVQFPAGSGLRCLPPSSVFDPVASFCMAIGFARGLQGWKQFRPVPTVLNLRGMWGWPAKGGNADRLASIRSRYEGQARALGFGASFVDREIPRFPGIDLGALYYQLGGKPP
jgi:hypothetical protein